MKTIELETPKQTSVRLQTTGADAVIQSLKAEGVKQYLVTQVVRLCPSTMPCLIILKK